MDIASTLTSAKSRNAARRRRLRWEAPVWLTIAVGIYVVLYVAWRHSSVGGERSEAVDELAFMVGVLAATITGWLAARRCSDEPRTASAWRLFAVAFLFATAAAGIKAGYAIVGSTLPAVSASDACWLCFYVLLPISFLRFPMRTVSRAGRRRLLIDTITITIGALSVVWFFLLGPTVAQGGSSTLTVIAAGGYPVGDVVLLFGLTYAMAGALVPATRFALGIVGTAIVLQVAGDVTLGWLLLHGEYGAGNYLNDIYVTAAALFVLGAASQRRVDSEMLIESRIHADEATARKSGLGRWLPYVVPAVVFGLLIGAQFGSPAHLRIGLAVCAAGVAALVMARQFLAQRDLLNAQGELSYLAMHDALTGLPNRALLLDRAEQLLAHARRQRSPIAALFIDIDGFKYINDTFGHAAGDELLKTIAARLSSLVRDSDTVGRIGGDEFVVLIDSLTLDVAPELVAERMLDVLRQPIDLQAAGSRTVTTTASVGVAMATQESADVLLRNADMAMYEAKTNGKNCMVVFESSMQTAVQDRLHLEMDLRDAIEQNQFFLLYQPTFDLQTETVTGVEALIRWHHPTRGVIAPDLFIPLAEETGLIIDIGYWVLKEACQQAATWHADGHPISIAINVSGRQLDDDQQLVDHVSEALTDSGLDAGALTLEVTETALMRNPELAATRLTALKELGLRIAIDDFGTGYSSMAYLRQFPVDALKIDRSFISGIANTAASSAILHSLVQLGKTLQLETLGEGIEETVQLRNLQREQCDSGQGFLFARPLAPDKLAEFIDATNNVGARPA